jgi:hypothetical protein
MFSPSTFTAANILWTLSVLIGGYIARSLTQLNVKMAVIVEKVTAHDVAIKENSADIKDLLKKIGD